MLNGTERTLAPACVQSCCAEVLLTHCRARSADRKHDVRDRQAAVSASSRQSAVEVKAGSCRKTSWVLQISICPATRGPVRELLEHCPQLWARRKQQVRKVSTMADQIPLTRRFTADLYLRRGFESNRPRQTRFHADLEQGESRIQNDA